MIEVIGYLGALLLAVCALPQMFMSIRQGHARGISHLFLLSWYIGELLMLAFCVETIGMSGPLFWNYLANIVMLSIIVRYKYFEADRG
jgi:uncharacterized protein with PQ loop repeat